jgi:mycofactocin precursor
MPTNATKLDRSPTAGGDALPAVIGLPEVGVPVADLAPTTLVEEEILVEEISIDGMCGVY